MFRLSLAVGLVSACLVALGYSPFNPTARPGDYWFALPVWGIASSLTYIALCWPSVYRELMAPMAVAGRARGEALFGDARRAAHPSPRRGLDSGPDAGRDWTRQLSPRPEGRAAC